MVKKVMFSYFSKCKCPWNAGVRKRWHDKIHNDLEHSQVRNWRRDTLDRNKWRDTGWLKSFESKNERMCIF